MVDPSGKCGVPQLLCLTAYMDTCECLESCNPPATAELKRSYGCIDDTSVPSVTLTPEQTALNSAVIIYTYRDGIPSESGNECIPQSYPGSMSSGTLTSQGIYTHDHYSLPEIIAETEQQVDVTVVSRATNPSQAQDILKQMGCIEVRGKNAKRAIAGDSLSFGNTVDGVVLISGDFSSIGQSAQISSTPPSKGDSVFYHYVIGNPNLVSSDRNVNVGGQILSANPSGIQWENTFALGIAEIDHDHEILPDNYGILANKSVFSTTEGSGYETITNGDSGGGWFNLQGELVGVSLGGANFVLYDVEYFSPLIIP